MGLPFSLAHAVSHFHSSSGSRPCMKEMLEALAISMRHHCSPSIHPSLLWMSPVPLRLLCAWLPAFLPWALRQRWAFLQGTLHSPLVPAPPPAVKQKGLCSFFFFFPVFDLQWRNAVTNWLLKQHPKLLNSKDVVSHVLKIRITSAWPVPPHCSSHFVL